MTSVTTRPETTHTPERGATAAREAWYAAAGDGDRQPVVPRRVDALRQPEVAAVADLNDLGAPHRGEIREHRARDREVLSVTTDGHLEGRAVRRRRCPRV